MVTLTGQLYAAAGLLASLINTFGTTTLMKHAGMLPLLMSSPAFLFFSALFSLFAPGVPAAFVGRMFENARLGGGTARQHGLLGGQLPLPGCSPHTGGAMEPRSSL